jgi:hypothetical protein
VPGATTLPRKVGAEVARATPTLALFGSAALAGGAAGSVLGPAGAAAGALLATVGTAFTVGWGPLYRRLRGLTQEDGVTPLLDEEQSKAWATAGAGAGAVAQVAIGAPFLKALPAVSGALQKVGLDAASRAASSTVGRAAVARLAEYGGHVLSGGLAMAAQSALSAAAVEAARDPSRLALPSMRMGVITGAAGPGWAEVTDAAAEGFKTGLLLAPLAAFEPVRQFFEDKGRIQTAKLEAARLSALAAASKDLGIIPAAPAEAEKVLAPLAAGTDSQTVYVSPEALTPEAQQAVANVVGPEAMAEAQATGGAVAVPIEKYLVHLADQHEALAQDVKLSPDGMTPREAEEWQKKIADISEPLNAGKLTEIAARGLGRTPTEAEVRATMKNLKALGFEIPETPPVVTGGTEAPAPEPHPIAAAIASVPVEEQAKLAQLIAPKPVEQVSPSKKAMAERLRARRVDAAGRHPPGPVRARLAARGRQARSSGDRGGTEAGKHRKFLLRYTEDDARGQLGKAGDAYLEQVDRLLAGFELGQGASRTEVARRLATMEWIANEQAAGREPVIPDSVMAKLDRFVHWKELTPASCATCAPRWRASRTRPSSRTRSSKSRSASTARGEERARGGGVRQRAGAAGLPCRVGGREHREGHAGGPPARRRAEAARGLHPRARRREGRRAVAPLHLRPDQGRQARLLRPARPGDAADRRGGGGDAGGRQEAMAGNPLQGERHHLRPEGGDRGDGEPRQRLERAKLLRGWADPSVERRGLTRWTEDTPARVHEAAHARRTSTWCRASGTTSRACGRRRRRWRSA